MLVMCDMTELPEGDHSGTLKLVGMVEETICRIFKQLLKTLWNMCGCARSAIHMGMGRSTGECRYIGNFLIMGRS